MPKKILYDERKKNMRTEDIKKFVAEDASYSFLRENEKLQNNIILLTLGGSHAYGTNVETSDIDVRGIATLSKKRILLGQDYEQFCNNATDTTIYSLPKIVRLLCSCNPNTIEMLGCKPEHYLYLSPIGQSLIDNRDMFLSKAAIHSFGGYAEQQLRRLENKAATQFDQARREGHILTTLRRAWNAIRTKYQAIPDSSIELYLDDAINPDLDSEIFMDMTLKHYPLRDYETLWSEMNSIVRSYDKLGQRNSKAFEHDKVGKHSMHLLRLYMMCIDILEKGEINTYREDEHDLLMSVRNNEFLDAEGKPIPEFYKLVDEYSKRLDKAAANSKLPERPDMDRIENWLYWANEQVVNK